MALENIQSFLHETRTHFRKLDVPQKAAIVSLAAFLVCSIFASTTLTFVLLGAGLVGFWTASSVVFQTQFFSSNFLLKYLPTLIDPLKPGGKTAEANRKSLVHHDGVQTNSSGSSGVVAAKKQDIQQQLSINYNMQKLISLVLKDFVYSWYNTISEDDNVLEEIEHHLYQLVEEDLPTRLTKINPISLLCIILELFQLHVHRYRRARTSLRRIARGKKFDSSSLIASYETFAILHHAVQSDNTELDYLRRCMDILQRLLLSSNIVQCKAAHHLLNEILSVNVLQSLVDLISDPDTVNEIIILILSDDNVITPPSPHESGASKTLQAGSQPKEPVSSNKDNGDELPSYAEAIINRTYEKHQSKVQLEQTDTKKQACDVHYVDPSFRCTNASQNSTGVLDRVSHHHEITSLGKAYQQEISSDKDKGHQSTDTMDGKSTVGSVCNRASHDESVHVTQLDKSTSTGFLASTLNIAALRLKDKIGIKETDGDSGKSEEDLVPEANVHHKASDLSRKSSGVRFSYLQRLGIQGIKREKSEEQLPAEHRKELKNDCESKTQEDDQMIPKQSENNPFQSSQHSPKEQQSVAHQSPISTSSFSFPIPFTSLGPSLPVLKPSSPKSPTKMKTEKKSSEFAIDEKVSNLKFDPVPMTGIGPSIPVKSDFKVYDSQTDNTESSEGRMSRSSSSSSFASVTYEDDQQNIPFEEIDLQFASGSSEMLGINDTKESTKMKPLKEADIDKRNEDGLGVNKFEDYISHKPETTPGELPNLLPSGIGMNPVRNSSKRLSWQGDFTFHDKQQGCQSEFDVPKVISSSEAKRQNVLIRVSPDAEIPRPDTKNVAFQPIAPAPSNTISPKKGGNRPVLNRSKTSPSLLSIQGMTKQEVARSEVRLMEAKVGRFHISAVTIPRTEVMKDRSGKEYVLYCIQYEVTAQGVLPMSRSSDGNVAGVVTKIVKRRHREFVNLHCRLDENLKFKQLLKGVRDPPRRMGVGLAFGVVSKTVYEHRRISLQHYLQQLINQPMLGHSEEIAEFLALGGDAHIEFVKKRTDIAPKIDQFLQWAVPSIVSTMKNAVPRAVVDLGTGAQMLSPPGSPKSQRRQKGRDITGALLGTRDGAFSPTPLDNLDMEWVHDNSRLQTRTLTQVQSAAHLFLEDHHDRETEPKPDRIQKPYPIKPIDLGPRFEGDGCDATELAEGEATKVPQTLPLEEIELLDKIMALLTEAMHGQGQPSWILDERLQKVVCVVVGKPLDRWIGDQIESLVSEQWCAYYLTLIQDAIWPNGQLIDSTVARTDEQKEHMRKEALQCLIDILPSYLQQVIGQDKWKACMEVMIDSLQDPQLNRHLVYTLLDLLLEAVATEITQHEFQETLLNSNTSLS